MAIEGDAQVVEGVGRLRLVSQGLTAADFGFAPATLVHVKNSQVVIDLDVIRAQAQGLFIAGRRIVRFALEVAGKAENIPDLRVRAVHVQKLATAVFCMCGVAGLQVLPCLSDLVRDRRHKTPYLVGVIAAGRPLCRLHHRRQIVR